MTDARPLAVRRIDSLPYGDGLALQADLVRRRRAGEIPDTLLLVEHDHVITLGSSSDPDHVLADPARRAVLGVELYETGRGGDVTYHGPGQLVGYPILDLKPDRKDLHAYLRDLEQVLIRVVAGFGVEAWQEEGWTGVWCARGKLAAIGVRVSSGWITSHGFALNVSTDLSYFDAIVPCGIVDREVVSLERVIGAPLSMTRVRAAVVHEFATHFGRTVQDSASEV